MVEQDNTYHLEALNIQIGYAIFKQAGLWYSVSVGNGWKPSRISDFKEVISLVLRNGLTVVNQQFEDEASLITFVRDMWNEEVNIPPLDVARVIDKLPEKIQRALGSE